MLFPLIEFIFDITRAVLRLFLSPFWWLGLWGPRPPGGWGHGCGGGPRPPHPPCAPGGWGHGGDHHHHHPHAVRAPTQTKTGGPLA